MQQSNQQNEQINKHQKIITKKDQQQSIIQNEVRFDEYIKKFVNKKFGKKSFQCTQISFWSNYQNLSHFIYSLRGSSTLTKKKFINPRIIKELVLRQIKIGDYGVKQICRKWYQWIKLQKLIIIWDIVTMKGVEQICKASEKKRFPQLAYLNLCLNKIGENKENFFKLNQNKQQSTQEGIILKLIDHTKLNFLDLDDNNINDNDILKLFKLKSQIQNNNPKQNLKKYDLTELRLSRNKITKNGLKCIIDFLVIINIDINKKSQQFYSKIQLNDNNLCSQAIKILVLNKKLFNNLKNLQLNNNSYIRDQGINHFMKACQEGAFSKLQSLSIQKINLSNNGVEKIIKQYHPSKSIKFLKFTCLQGNQSLINKQQVKKKLQKRFNSQISIK